MRLWTAGAAPLRRLLACIRFDEVLVLQGAPLFGACFAMRDVAPSVLATLAVLVAANTCLVAHVFVLNDWSGIDNDQMDPNRCSRTFLATGANAAEVGALAVGLLAMALLLCLALGTAALLIAAAIAVLSALYSLPWLNGKGIPVFNSSLHLAGGTLHFLFGYAAIGPVSWQGVAIGGYFGLVFMAGHLTHEARDHDGDALAAMRTNAVTFGRKAAVLASFAGFTLAYIALAILAFADIVPRVLAFCALFYPLHLFAVIQAFRAGLGFDSLRRLQGRYRRIHAAIGLLMLLALLPMIARLGAGPA